MRWLRNFRWPVKLALLVIALLAVIALGSGWWLPWDPAAINLQQRLLPPGGAHWEVDFNRSAQCTGWEPIILDGIFSRACWPPPASRWGR